MPTRSTALACVSNATRSCISGLGDPQIAPAMSTPRVPCLLHAFIALVCALLPARECYGARRVLVQGGTHTNWYGVYSVFGLLPGGSDGAKRTPLNVLIDIVDNRFLGIRDDACGILMDGVAGGRIRGNQVVGGKRIQLTGESRGIVVEGNSHA